MSGETPAGEEGRVREPYDRRRPVRWGVLLVAVAAAALGAWVAPERWPTGPGSVEVRVDGELRISQSVEVGTSDPVSVVSAAAGLETQLDMPDGVPADAPIDARVRILRDGSPTRPDSVEVTLVLPDGSREPIPVLRWNQEQSRVEASRRPPVDAAVVLGLLGMVVVLWVTEALPLFVTSLAIPVVLAVTGAASASEALAPFFHPIIALFFGGFLMAEAMRRAGLDHLAAINLVARTGRSPATLLLAMIGVSAFLSMWMSNTAATAVLVPIALAVTGPLHDLPYRKVVVLGIAYAATIGGVGSAIGTPANPLAIEFLRSFAGRDISFVAWFGFGLPMVVIFLPLMAAYLWRRSGVRVDRTSFAAARRAAAEELARAGRPTRDQLIVLGVFAAVMLVWLTQTMHRLDTGIVAVAGAVALAVLRKILPEDLGRISWASLLTFGGGLALGLSLTQSGTSDWLATRLTGLSALPTLPAVAIVATIALALTTVASNTATAAMLVPLAIPLAGVIGVDPTLLVVVVAIASSVDFALVIGTPPTMIAYSTELFTAREIFRTGIVLDVAGVLVLVTAVLGVWTGLGLI